MQSSGVNVLCESTRLQGEFLSSFPPGAEGPSLSHDCMCAYAPWMLVNMADEHAEAELDWSGRQSLLLDEDTFFAMEGLQATFQQLEAELRQQDVSEESSTEYCNNFCQVRVAENAACMRIVYVQRFRALVARVS